MKLTQNIFVTVTNDLHQDQRMYKICTSLVDMGHVVTLIGRQKNDSLPLTLVKFGQVRLKCLFFKGFLFYVEYNIRLFIYLFARRQKIDIIYSVDTDTILAGGVMRVAYKKKQVFDAHEYFTEVPELSNKPIKKWMWKSIEQIFIPRADIHITVSESLAGIFSAQYQKRFYTIRNVPYYKKMETQTIKNLTPTIVYQGMLNAGRGLEQMIAAMPQIQDATLVIVGEGDISAQLRQMAAVSPAKDRIRFEGWKSFDEIKMITHTADIAINLLDGNSKSYYYSLANKFFDYMHAGIPSVNMDFPEYREIISKYEVGVLLSSLTPDYIASSISSLLYDPALMDKMREYCALAAREYNWQAESEKLRDIMQELEK